MAKKHLSQEVQSVFPPKFKKGDVVRLSSTAMTSRLELINAPSGKKKGVLTNETRTEVGEIFATTYLDSNIFYSVGIVGTEIVVLDVPESELTLIPMPQQFIRLTNFGVNDEQRYQIDVRPSAIRAKHRGLKGGTTVVVESGPAGTFHVVETPDEIDRLIAELDGWPGGL